jgi:hypothetical protein
MMKEISIIKKDEAYTYDELEMIEESLLPLVVDEDQREAAGDILRSLKASLENQKTSAAVFFMPKNTFNIFSLIQGDNSICKISNENIESLCKAINLADNLASKPIFSHLKKKLQVLNEYLQQGNEVTPTVIAADNFSLMEI